jgi:hypothetical protein
VVQLEQRSAEVPVSLFDEWRHTPWVTRDDRGSGVVSFALAGVAMDELTMASFAAATAMGAAAI